MPHNFDSSAICSLFSERACARSLFAGRHVISIIGCGGKTSLMWSLAQHQKATNPAQKILVTTTTHTQRPEHALHLFDHFIGDDEAQRVADGSAPLSAGINFSGSIDGASGALHSLPLPLLETMIPHFDYVVIEADGSRQKPLKAWADYEPVIVAGTTITVGIIPVYTVGMSVSDTIIHRLPLWTTLTGAREHDIIRPQHLADTICGANGKSLFSAAIGKKILFLNHIKNQAAMNTAQDIVNLLPKAFVAGLEDIIVGV